MCFRGSLFRSAVDGESQYDYHLLVHLVEVRGSASRFPANSSKLLLATPETGHARSSGLSSKGVPGWKSCRRRIPIIYRRNHPSPLLQSGSGAVFVAEQAVSVTPYRKTISPQTTQLLFLSLSLSKIGIIDGFVRQKHSGNWKIH